MIIAILTLRAEFWQPFLPLMEQRGFETRLVDSPARTGRLLREAQVALVLVDLPYNFESVRRSLGDLAACGTDARLALVSNLGKKDYQEATDGLGLLLGLPQQPGENDVLLLLDKLERELKTKKD